MLNYVSTALLCLIRGCLYISDLEADSNILRQEVEKLLQVVLQHQALESSHCLESEKHNSLVHCGRTKVFLTQSMVSHLCTQAFSYII